MAGIERIMEMFGTDQKLAILLEIERAVPVHLKSAGTVIIRVWIDRAAVTRARLRPAVAVGHVAKAKHLIKSP